MDKTITELFERALDDEPVPPPGDLAGSAMATGRRLRRRRQVLAGGSVAAVVATVTAGVLTLIPGDVATQPANGAVPCVAVVFLRDDITGDQTTAVERALTGDSRVRNLELEDHLAAYKRFKELWVDNPEYVKSVSPQNLPVNFRAGLADPLDFPAVAAQARTWAGVDMVDGEGCQ